MREETLLGHEPWPDLRLDQLQTLARLERRAESLRAELAALQELLTCIVQQPAPNTAWGELCGSETILIADDQVIVRAITQGMLESFGYRTLVADADLGGTRFQSGPAASTQMESRATDLVLLDVPFWDDRARLSLWQIRARSVPIVVSTPLPEGPARQQLRLAGAVAFVSKPLNPLELARCIRQVLDVTCPPSTG
jgi:CheY-like chemotaxis protein